MARGKNGISAAARHAVEERDKQIEAYQHNIRKLTAENAELKEKIDEMRVSHGRTVGILKTERDEGLSPMLSALQAEIVRLKEDLQGAIAANRKFVEAYKKAILRMKGHFQSAHGLTQIEAAEETDALLGDTENLFFTQEDYRPLAQKDPEGIQMVQRARRQRS